MIEDRPFDIAASNMLAMTLAKQGNLDEAEKLLLAVTRDEPGYADAWYNLGIIHASMGELIRAREDFRMAYSSSSQESFKENAAREIDEIDKLIADNPGHPAN